ncbi:protein of unknown function [Hyphomicrobium sp. 1Nfss2.1]
MKAAASAGALASSTFPAWVSFVITIILISAGDFPFRPAVISSRAAVRPSDVSMSASSAFISGLAFSALPAVTTAFALAMLSFNIPQIPLGSAMVTAKPASMGLERTSFHSSGVKLDLSAIDVLAMLRNAVWLALMQTPLCHATRGSDGHAGLGRQPIPGMKRAHDKSHQVLRSTDGKRTRRLAPRPPRTSCALKLTP